MKVTILLDMASIHIVYYVLNIGNRKPSRRSFVIICPSAPYRKDAKSHWLHLWSLKLSCTA
jgi:hypothetical protein